MPWSERAETSLMGAHSGRQAGSGSVLGAGAVIFLGATLANLASYGFVVLLSRCLEPEDLGAVGTLMNLAAVLSVLGLGAQLVAARDTAGGHDHAGSHLNAALRVGLVISAAGLLAAPALAALLHVGAATTAMAALSGLPMTLAFSMQGVIHGRRRFVALGVATAAVGVSRLLFGFVALGLGWGPTGIMALVTLSWAVAAAIAWWLADCPRPGQGAAPARLVRSILDAASPMSGLLLLGSLDLLLVRHVHPTASGDYTVGSLFARVAFWGLSFVATVVFPRLTDSAGRSRALLLATTVTTVLGGVGLGLATLLGPALVIRMSGDAYASIGGSIWRFVLIGVALAVLQLMIYADLAQSGRLCTAVVWGAVALVTVVVLRYHGSVAQVATCTAVVLWGAVGLAAAVVGRAGWAGTPQRLVRVV